MSTGSQSPDCIVVGGGLVGLLSARALARAGLQVTVLEKGALFSESSWAGGGILSPLVPWQYPDAVSELVRWSQQHYAQLCRDLHEQTGIDPQWTRSGLVIAGTVPDAHSTAWLARYAGRHATLDAAQLAALAPALAAGHAPAMHLPDVAQVRNPRLGKALIRALEDDGLDLQTGVAVRRVRVGQGSVRGVETDNGLLSTERVVVAGGAWSAQILDGLVAPVPVAPVLGQMIQFRAAPGLLQQVVVSDGHYLVPRRDGLVLAGSTLEYTGFNKHTTVAAREQLMAAAFKMLPALSATPVVGHWCGLRPGSDAGIPLVGEHRAVRGLYLNTGHFRNGVVMAPASAELLAQGVCGHATLADPAPYRPGAAA